MKLGLVLMPNNYQFTHESFIKAFAPEGGYDGTHFIGTPQSDIEQYIIDYLSNPAITNRYGSDAEIVIWHDHSEPTLNEEILRASLKDVQIKSFDAMKLQPQISQQARRQFGSPLSASLDDLPKDDDKYTLGSIAGALP